jgi:hypothetical protein
MADQNPLTRAAAARTATFYLPARVPSESVKATADVSRSHISGEPERTAALEGTDRAWKALHGSTDRPWRLTDDDRDGRGSAAVRDWGSQYLGLDSQDLSCRDSGRRSAAGYRTDGTAAVTAKSIRAWSRLDPRDWRLPPLCGQRRRSIFAKKTSMPAAKT